MITATIGQFNDLGCSKCFKINTSHSRSVICIAKHPSAINFTVGHVEEMCELVEDDITPIRFVAALLFLTLASLELVLVTLLPLGIGLWWTFGLMGWLGLPIDLMNSIFVIFVIGVGEDYAVFLVTSKLEVWRGESSQAAVNSASVLVSALTTIFGFGVMVIANHPVLFSMGVTVLIGMGFAFLATLIIVPISMDLLLFKDPPRGAPRWWHPLGTIWVLLHLGGSQVFLYYMLRPILKIVSPATATDKLRRATRWMARGVSPARAAWLASEMASERFTHCQGLIA